MAWFAWTDIHYGADVEKDSGVILKVKAAKAGESVSAAKLGLSEDQFQQLVDAGSVRAYKSPHEEMKKASALDMSPVEFLREKAAAQSEDEQLAAVGSGGSYFGPNEEELLLGEGDVAEEEEAKK